MRFESQLSEVTLSAQEMWVWEVQRGRRGEIREAFKPWRIIEYRGDLMKSVCVPRKTFLTFFCTIRLLPTFCSSQLRWKGFAMHPQSATRAGHDLTGMSMSASYRRTDTCQKRMTCLMSKRYVRQKAQKATTAAGYAFDWSLQRGVTTTLPAWLFCQFASHMCLCLLVGDNLSFSGFNIIIITIFINIKVIKWKVFVLATWGKFGESVLSQVTRVQKNK